MHTEVDANEVCWSLVIGNYFRLVRSRVLGGLVCLRLRLAMAQVLIEVQGGPMTA